MAGSHKVSQGQFLIASCRPACRAAIAAVRSALYNHIRIICSHYWCPDMRFGRRRQPLVRHRGRLSLRCKNDYPPSPPTPPRPFIRAQGGYCAAPPVRPRATRRPSCWTAPTPPPLGPFIRAQRGGRASILLPMGPLQVPVGWNILFTKKTFFVLILTNLKTMDRLDRAHNRQANGT